MRALAVVAVLAATSTAHAGGGAIFIPPAEVDIGFGTPIGGAATIGTRHDILAGIHWASMYWHPTPIDVGLGVLNSQTDVLPGYALRTTGDASTSSQNLLTMTGGYVSLGYTLQSRTYVRTWLDARVETLRASVNEQSFTTLGAALRLSTEVYLPVAGGDRNALIAGTLALGVYVEGVRRGLPPELGPNAITTGFSMRVPMILAGG